MLAAVATVPFGFDARRAVTGGQVLVGEAESDLRTDHAAVRCGRKHLQARVDDVTCRENAVHRRSACRVGREHLPEPGRMRSRCEPKAAQRFDAGMEPGTDEHGIGGDSGAVGEVYAERAVGIRHPGRGCGDHGDT